MELAAKHREAKRGNDPVMDLAVTILDIADEIEELYKRIQENTLFEADDEFVPVAVGFKNPEKVLRWQEEIAELQAYKEELEGYLTGIEIVFNEHAKRPVGLAALQEEQTAIINKPYELSLRITRRVKAMIAAEPTISMALVYSDPDVQALEIQKYEAGQAAKTEAESIRKLIDKIEAITSQTKGSITLYWHPGRAITASMMCEVGVL
jgi:hypothetical protein